MSLSQCILVFPYQQKMHEMAAIEFFPKQPKLNNLHTLSVKCLKIKMLRRFWRAVATPLNRREWHSASAIRWRCCAMLCEATSIHKVNGIVPHQGDPSATVKGEGKDTHDCRDMVFLPGDGAILPALPLHQPSHLTPHCHLILQSHLLSSSILSVLNSTASPAVCTRTCGTCNGQLMTVPLNGE